MLSIHPLAEIFPPMSDEEIKGLIDDIKANGLREPIILFEHKVLDGRNRHRACAELGIEPQTRQWDHKGDPLDYVISKNMHRRHLNESQRGVVADKIATLSDGQRADLTQGAQFRAPAISQANAPERLNVSRRTVQNARVLRENGIPELQAAVEVGQVSVSAASKVAKLPANRQREIVASGPKDTPNNN